jgi:phosphoribosylanthranilate isomerase
MIDLAAMPVFIKICGVTTVEDALAIHAQGATAIGLILTSSKRQVSVETATKIAQVTEGLLCRVAVFRNNDADFICEVVDATRVEAVQVHGPLSDELLGQLRRRDVAVIKALSTDEDDFDTFDPTKVDAVLVDGPTPGTGEMHSWVDATRRDFGVPLIAAGGLNPSNVVSIIETVRPWGVDVATGVEERPGVKDVALVGSFIGLARAALVQREE